jgi:hypothetical protein
MTKSGVPVRSAAATAFCLLLVAGWAWAQVDVKTDDNGVRVQLNQPTTQPARDMSVPQGRLDTSGGYDRDTTKRGSSERLFSIKREGKWGFADEGGKILISPQFQDVRGFQDGLAAIKINDRWGYIDKDGKFVIGPGV